MGSRRWAASGMGGDRLMGNPEVGIDVSHYASPQSFANRLGRVVWGVVWLFLFRPSPTIFHFWRRALLRLFGARIGKGAHPYRSARIWAPWNLQMGECSCLGQHVDCYCADKVAIGPHATVSQHSRLCTASHDYEDRHMRLVTAPITICAGAWVAADVFVTPGVTVGEGAVVGARAVVTKDVIPWTVVAGNPAIPVRRRRVRGTANE